MHHTVSVKGYSMILVSSIVFATYGIWSKLMGDQFDVFYQGWVRSLIVLMILVPILVLTKSHKKIEKEDRKWFLLTALFAIGTQAPLYYAFNTTSVGTAILMFYASYIVISYVLGKVLIGEKITKIKLAAMGLAFGGLGLVFGLSITQFALLGLLMAAFNGVASGGDVASTKKYTDKYSSLMVTAYAWGAILVTHLPISLLLGEKQWAPANTTQWWSMLAYAIAGILAFWLVVEGYKYVDASIGSLIGLLEIIWAVVFGVWLFDERVSLSIWLGGALILIAGVLPDLYKIRQDKQNNKTDGLAREL